MKILVLMPCDETAVYSAIEIYKNLDEECKNCTLNMPVYMDYLLITKQAENLIYALAYAMTSAKKGIVKDQDLIVFGNVPKNITEFDAIFSFQDGEKVLPYKDLFIERTKVIFKDSEELKELLDNLYTNDDAKLNLTNSKATAAFLSDYMKTKVDFNELRKKYGFLNLKDKEDLND